MHKSMREHPIFNKIFIRWVDGAQKEIIRYSLSKKDFMEPTSGPWNKNVSLKMQREKARSGRILTN